MGCPRGMIAALGISLLLVFDTALLPPRRLSIASRRFPVISLRLAAGFCPAPMVVNRPSFLRLAALARRAMLTVGASALTFALRLNGCRTREQCDSSDQG